MTDEAREPVRGLEALIDPEGDYVWRDGRYEYVRRPVPVIGGLSGVPWWQDPEYQRMAAELNGATDAEAVQLFADCWALIDRMRAQS